MKKKYNSYLVSGFFICLVLFLLSLYGIFGTSISSTTMSSSNKFSSPSLTNLFGTDNYGRDIFVRSFEGLYRTLYVAIFTILLGGSFGLFIGAIAGWFGGRVDTFIMKICDIIKAFPWLLLALISIAIIGVGDSNIIIVLSIVFIPSFARVTRSCLLTHKNMGYVQGGKMTGASSFRIIFFHIFPNIFNEIVSSLTVGFASAVLSEATLSFLGLGIQPPYPSLGRMLSEAQSYLFIAPWMAIFPGIIIVLVVIAFNNISLGVLERVVD